MANATTLKSSEIYKIGEDIYSRIRSTVDAGNDGKFIAIDVLSGDYEIGDKHLDTALRLKGRHTISEVYTKRIGYATTVAIGGRLQRETPK